MTSAYILYFIVNEDITFFLCRYTKYYPVFNNFLPANSAVKFLLVEMVTSVHGQVMQR